MGVWKGVVFNTKVEVLAKMIANIACNAQFKYLGNECNIDMIG